MRVSVAYANIKSTTVLDVWTEKDKIWVKDVISQMLANADYSEYYIFLVECEKGKKLGEVTMKEVDYLISVDKRLYYPVIEHLRWKLMYVRHLLVLVNCRLK